MQSLVKVPTYVQTLAHKATRRKKKKNHTLALNVKQVT